MALPTQDTGAFDFPNEKDFYADHILGAGETELPAKLNLNNQSAHDQGRSMRCTAYGITHCLEILKTLEHNLRCVCDPNEMWANELYDQGGNPEMEKHGTSLQVALNALLKHGLTNKSPDVHVDTFKINGYAVIEKSLPSIMRWLARGFPVYTGANGHCFALVGYDTETKEILWKNSYGDNTPSRGALGIDTIPFAQIDKLFSLYILYTKADMDMIFKDVSVESPNAESIKWARDNKIMTGYGTGDDYLTKFFKPEQNLTRAEFAVVAKRLYELLKK